MTPREQRDIVRYVTEKIMDEIADLIDAGKVPKEWNGVEIRELIADKAATFRAPVYLKGKRLKDYKNTVLVNNLL